MKRHLTRWVVLSSVLALTGPASAGLPGSRPEPAPASVGAEARALTGGVDIVERLERLGNFSILLAALRTANLEDAVANGGPFTLFAPTDAAFADLLARLQISAADLLESPDLADILLYHVAPDSLRAGRLLRASTQSTLNPGRPVLVVLEGNDVLVNRAKVLRANVPASNGLIHIIDGVLLPPEEPIAIAGVADVLALDGRFTVLLEALRRTGLDDALAGDGPFTVFAPTDEAFARLLAKLEVSSEELLANPELADILLYHVLGSRLGASQLLVARRQPTLQGGDVTVRGGRGGLRVNDARIVNPNVNAPNGLIHTIEDVLLP